MSIVLWLGLVITLLVGDEQDVPRLENCLLLIGDSVADGSAVFEVPGHGFPVIQTTPFSAVLDAALHERGALHIGVYDLTVGAASLTGNLPYMDTPAYAFALAQPCRFVVLFPWLNELGTAGEAYVRELADFAAAFQQPGRTIILLNYYRPVISPLGERIYEGNITLERVTQANDALAAACAPEGALAAVVCIDVTGLYPGDDHVLSTLDRATYMALGYAPVNPDDAGLLAAYWNTRPEGLITGDGVHLNEAGKQTLAAALLDQLAASDALTLPVSR